MTQAFSFASLAAAGAIGLAALLPTQANAASFAFTVTDGGIDAAITITYGAETDAKYAAAYVVTGISGSFSSTALGIDNATILGLVKTNFATPDAQNLLAPRHFSRFSVADGLPPINNGYITYDNLYWPGGSPQTASDYPASGGFLDIYGLMFRIGNGRVVNLWSNGTFGGGAPVTYGVHVASVDQLLTTVDGVTVTAVPEPTTIAMLLAGLGVVGGALRRRAATAA